MNIKTQFPDEASLSNFIRENTDSYVGILREKVGHLEEGYKVALKNFRSGSKKIAFALALFFGPIYIFNPDFIGISSSVSMSVMLVSIPLSIYLGVKGWKQLKGTRKVLSDFNLGINSAIFPIIFNIFSVEADHISHTVEGEEDPNYMEKGRLIPKSNKSFFGKVQKNNYTQEHNEVVRLLDFSELITEPRNTMVVQDIVVGDYEGKTIFLSELDVKHVTGSGKNRKVKNIFYGYFISLDLDINLKGKTFVSTEGDKKGFGHQSFWKNIKNSENRVEVTELEWNDFENLLHVATNDPTEARYVLSTDFMHDLYEWWKDKKQNIRIAFIGSRMYMLFPDKRIKFSGTVNNLSGGEVIKYMESIALPLLHVMHLAEDTKNQFNHS